MNPGELGEPSTRRVTRSTRRRAAADLVPVTLSREFTYEQEEVNYASPPEEAVVAVGEIHVHLPEAPSDSERPDSPPGEEEPPSPGGGDPDPMAAQMANPANAPRRAPVTRLKYNRFKGDGGKDVDDWLEEFNAIAEANMEDAESRLRLFSGLLKGEALKWYLDVPLIVRGNWEQLTEAFKHTFREAGGEARALSRLGKIKKRESESIRKYGQRMKALMNKVAVGIAPVVAIQWYIGGLPDDMAFQIRRTKPETLREAMEAAQDYEESAQALRSSKDKGRKSKGKKVIESTSDSSADSNDTGSDDPDSSDSDGKIRPGRTKNSKKDKAGQTTVKIKAEKEDGLKKVLAELEAIKVNMAELQSARKAPPAQRANVWCSRCRQSGHYPTDCPIPAPTRSKFTDRNGVHYVVGEEEFEGEEEYVTIYQVQPGYSRGRGSLPRPDNGSYRSNPGRSTPGQPGVTGTYLDHVVCYRCGRMGHYANNCDVPQVSGGAMKPLPCQNCHEYGHPATNCPKPAQPKVNFKEAQIPTREQSGLNYGSTVGIENPST